MIRWWKFCFQHVLQKGKSEGFDSCDRPYNLTQIGLKSLIFCLCDIEIWCMTPKNNKARLLYYIKLCVSFQIHQWIQTGVTVRKRPIWVKFEDFLSRVTLQPIFVLLQASFRSHWWIKTGVTVRKHPIWVKIADSFSRVTLQFDVWP